MRLLWYSNSDFTGTGYGEQTRLVVERLVRDGHVVAEANNYGVHGGVRPSEIPGVPILPQGADLYSSDILPAHYAAWCGDKGEGWLITLYDVWPLNLENLAPIPHIASWVPVDHAPVPLETVRWFSQTGAIPIAMSEFGQTQLEAVGVPEVRYIPHAIDLATWRPRDAFEPGGRMPAGKGAREVLGIPEDAFLVNIRAANKGAWPPRKGWNENITALAQFMAANPDVYAYIHTERTKVQHGIDIEKLAAARGMDPKRTRFADRYMLAVNWYRPVDLAVIDSASDVGLLASMGEGFGLPVVEQMACGVPQVVSNFSSQPEIVGDTGWLAEGQPWWDDSHGADFYMPFIDSIIDGLERAYAARGDQDRRARARARVAERYDVEKVYAEKWQPLLAELEGRLTPAEKNLAIRPKRAAKGRRR